MSEYIILLTWDDEAFVWVAENDDIPIALESDSLDKLIERVRLAVPELLELNKNNKTDTWKRKMPNYLLDACDYLIIDSFPVNQYV